MIMDSALFITSLFALVSALTTFFLSRSNFRLWIDYPPISWTGWWICLLLDVLLCLPILWTRHGSQSTPTFLEICTGYPSFYVSLVACLFATSFLPASLNPVPCSITTSYYRSSPLLALRFYLQKRLNIRSASAGPTRY